MAGRKRSTADFPNITRSKFAASSIEILIGRVIEAEEEPKKRVI